MDVVRLKMLDQLSWDIIKFSYAPSSLNNMHTHNKRYLEFCTIFKLTAFPVSQWQLVRFATFLSFHFISPKSIQNYLSSICTIHELNGHPPVVKGIYFRKALAGMRRKLRHKENQAKPFTFELLHRILPLVNFKEDKQMVCWVTLIFAFHLFLRKSNLVPEARYIDDEKQFQRRDFRIHNDVILAHVKWAKNRQHGESKLLIPIVRNKESDLCPFYWFLYMVNRIPAPPDAAAFSYPLKGVLVPLTYRETLLQLRAWLDELDIKSADYGLHSARRGGATTAFEAGLPSLAIRVLGDWASEAFLRYIDVTLDTRLKASALFSLQDKIKRTDL